MDKKSISSWDLPTDALAEILVRLPPNVRRRFRAVCRHWLELIDQLTAKDMQKRTKIVVVTDEGVPRVVDVLRPGTPTNLWERLYNTVARRYGAMSIVGTCNGLLCLCDDSKPAGAITVANPSTGEALPLPPLPMPPGATVHLSNSNNISWHQRYNFAYHPMMGRYKVVHVPSHLDLFWQPDMLHVFTLGEASWREVQVDTYARCRLGRSSLADVDGTLYWLMEHPTGEIMSFDLKHERVARTEPLPVTVMPSTCHLTKVHGRLGVVIGDDDRMTVWVLEGERWIYQYVWEANKVRQEEKWLRREVVMPHFVLGDYFLTSTQASTGEPFLLYRHTMSGAERSQDGVVQIRHKNWRELALVAWFRHPIYQVFAYIETKEPLSVYKAGLVRN